MNFEEYINLFKKLSLDEKADTSGEQLALKIYKYEKRIYIIISVLIVIAILNLDFSVRVLLSPLLIILALLIIMHYQSRFNSTIYNIYFIDCNVDLLISFIIHYFDKVKSSKRRLADFTFAFMIILFELEKYECILEYFKNPKKIKLHRNHLLMIYLAAIFNHDEKTINNINEYENSHNLYNEPVFKNLKDDISVLYRMFNDHMYNDIIELKKNNYDMEIVKLYYKFIDIICYEKLEMKEQYSEKINELWKEIEYKNSYYLKSEFKKLKEGVNDYVDEIL